MQKMKTRNTKNTEEWILEIIPPTEEERSENMRHILKSLDERCANVTETKILISKHDKRHSERDNLKKLKASRDLKKTLRSLLEKQEEAVKILCAIIALQGKAEELYEDIIIKYNSVIEDQSKN